MKKILAVLLVLAVAASMMVSCKGKGGSLIGIAMPETHVLRWTKDGSALQAEAEKKGYRAEVQYGDANQPTQNQQIQSFLTQGAKALIVGCITDGVASVVAEAAKIRLRLSLMTALSPIQLIMIITSHSTTSKSAFFRRRAS